MGKKDMAVVFRRAEAQGFRVEHTRGGHVRIVPPDPDKGIVHASGSDGDHRAVRNLISQLVQRGYRHARV